MYLYHGTSLENALQILESRDLKGKKAYKHHKNRYVAFSKNFYQARKFGEVIFKFPMIEHAVKVEYKEDWMKENQEIIEYILHDTDKEDHEDITHMKEKKEYIVENRYRFTNEPVTIYLLGDTMAEMKEGKSLLRQHICNEDVIKRSVKMNESFINSTLG